MPDYELIERLGQGNFGEVWLAHDKALGVDRAVKFVKPSRIKDPTRFYDEPQTLMQLQHENVVQVADAGTTPDKRLYIAMEYLPKGSIEKTHKGKPLPLLTARGYLCDVCRGLEYAHQQGFIHRDIKPANILVSEQGKAKLSDFGLATRAPREAGASPYGYLTHLAPEVFEENRTDALTDIYALGVTAYRLLNGDAFLPQLETETDLIDLVIAGKYPDRKHYRPNIPRRLRQVINKAMHPDRAMRYQSAAAFRHALEAIEVKCNWFWRYVRQSVIYKAKIGSTKIKVIVRKCSDDRFEVITTKRRQGKAERRVGVDCHQDLALPQMKSLVRAILSRYVTKGA